MFGEVLGLFNPGGPMVRDLTADDRAFLHTGGRIDCKVIGGQWVKVRVPAPASRPMSRRASARDSSLARAGAVLAIWDLEDTIRDVDESKRKAARR